MRSLKDLSREVPGLTRELIERENGPGVEFAVESAFLNEWTWAIHGRAAKGWDSMDWQGWLCPICTRDVEDLDEQISWSFRAHGHLHLAAAGEEWKVFQSLCAISDMNPVEAAKQLFREQPKEDP